MNHKAMRRDVWLAVRATLVAALLAVPLPAAVSRFRAARTKNVGRKKLPKYETKYYVLHTDLDKDMVREASARITSMAEEYHRRTKGFAGVIRKRFPFYLYRNPADYMNHPDVIPGSAGIYTGTSLVAIAPRPGGSWRVVQHEGFHQFAHKMIRGRLPVWLDEGLAEYFGEGIWTGDRLMVGVINPGRLARVETYIKNRQLLKMQQMLTMPHREWNSGLSMRNYDQAWSMVHFLVHAQEGRYQKALSAHIRDLSRGRGSVKSWVARFGRNVEAFQAKYAKWCLSLDPNSSADLYARITVLTLTGFLARARYAERQFNDFGEFRKAAGDGTFDAIFKDIAKRNTRLWLPVSLLNTALRSAGDPRYWSLVNKKGAMPQVKFTRPDGTVFTGVFTLKYGKLPVVKVVVNRPTSAPAKSGGARPSNPQ